MNKLTQLRQNSYPEAYILSLLVLILGFIVIIGWITHTKVLIQVIPSFVPMQFNTALGFIFSALMMFFIQKLPKISFIFSILLIILSILTLLSA